MILSDVSIKRPVFATVISLLIVVFGVSALMKLPIREYPDIDPPEVSISVDYAGAAPEVIDTQIIQVIEGAISGVEGVRKIESRSRLGSARTTVEFTLERDVDIAANDVRDAVSRVLNRLPEEAETPVIAKADADARPIIWVTLTSSTLAPQELTDFAERSLVDRFAVLDGVSEVIIGGERRYAMRVWLDRQTWRPTRSPSPILNRRCAVIMWSYRRVNWNRNPAASRFGRTIAWPPCRHSRTWW